mgnify:CR=1 FL=1
MDVNKLDVELDSKAVVRMNAGAPLASTTATGAE